MDSLVTLQHCRRSLHLPVDRFPIASTPFRSRLHIASVPFKSSSSSSIRSSVPSPSSSSNSFRKNLEPIPSSILKTTCVTFAATAALLLMRFSGKPAIAALNLPPTEEPDQEWMDRQEDEARKLEEQLANNPNDVNVLAALMKVRYHAPKLPEALNNVNRLIELEPEELKWVIWRGFVFSKIGNSESARNDFERALEKDPCRFKAYQGLAYTFKPSDTDALDAMQKRVKGVLENYKEHIAKNDVTRFKMLISETKFMKGCYSEALTDLYKLLREDPENFSSHLLLAHFLEDLGNKDGADKQYEICGKLENNWSYNSMEDSTTDSKECKK